MKRQCLFIGLMLLVMWGAPAFAQNHPPVAEAGPDQVAYTGDIVLLNGLGADPDGDTIVAWSWAVLSPICGASGCRLDDSDRPTALFVGYQPGDYVLSFGVVDANANFSFPDYVTVHVHDNLPPVAVATANKTTAAVGDQVCFSGSQSTDPEGSPLRYDWDLGDGTTVNTATVCHSYPDQGTYTVTFAAIDIRNAFDTAMLTIYVTPATNSPVAIPKVTEHRITSPAAPTPAWEMMPRLGNTGTFDVVVYASRELLPDGGMGKGDIWYQRLDHGQPVGTPVQITDDAQNNLAPDVSGDYIVYLAYDSTSAPTGRVMVYRISDPAYVYGIGSALALFDAHISGDRVVWREGWPNLASQVLLYDLAWLGTTRDADVIAGPIPPVSDVDIGERFVVWTELSNQQTDIFAYDLLLGTKTRLTDTPLVFDHDPSTSGPWIAWEAQDTGVSHSRIMALNMDTQVLRTIVDDGVWNSRPSIDGDLIAWESMLNGYFDVYIHRLSSNQTFRITRAAPEHYNSDIFRQAVAYIDQRSGNEDVYVSVFAFPCDVNNDGLVNRTDINLIFAAVGKPATGPDDPRDADGDGKITIYDARKCVLACTKTNCAL